MTEIYFIEEYPESGYMPALFFLCPACLSVTNWDDGAEGAVCNYCWAGEESPNPSIAQFMTPRPLPYTIKCRGPVRRRANPSDIDTYYERLTSEGDPS